MFIKLGSFMNKLSGSALPLGIGLLLATPSWPGERPSPLPPATALLTATPIPFDENRPDERRTGALEFLGGWALASDDPRFGGLSAVDVEGEMATAISDAGVLFRFALPGTPRFGTVRVARLPQGPEPDRRKADRDAEALLFVGTDIWVVWEYHRQIWRYGRDWRARAAAEPEAMRRLDRDVGAEAMVRLGDGRFLLLAETESDRDGLSEAILFGGDPTAPRTPAARLFFRPPPGFRPTDAALLPDGRLLVLSRRWRLLGGFTAALTLVDAAGIGPGAVLAGREIARFERPPTADNMEGLSVTREGGRTIVWIVSDDNFSPLQRTLLLRFALVE